MTSRERFSGPSRHVRSRTQSPSIFPATVPRASPRSPTRGLRRHLGLPQRPVRVYDPIQQLAVIDDDVLARFGVDTVEMGRGFSRDTADWQEWTLPDGSPCLMPAWVNLERRPGEWVMKSTRGTVLGRMPDGALYFEQVNFPFLESDDLPGLARAYEECMWTSKAAAAPPGPAADGPDGQRRLREGALQLRAATDRAVIGLFGGNLLEAGQFLYRNDNFLHAPRGRAGAGRGVPGRCRGAAPGEPPHVPRRRG